MRDEVADLFGGASRDEKQEAFEQSSLSLVLRQLGASNEYVQSTSRTLGPAYTFDWFNDEAYIDPVVMARRCFTFSLEKVFSRPSKSPLVTLYDESLEAYRDEDWGRPLILIFKVYELGRLVLTELEPMERTFVHVHTASCTFNVTLLSGFFRERFGTPLEEL